MERTLILASESPQRRKFLEELGWPFVVMPSHFDEDGHPESDPPTRALTLARHKAETIAREHPDSVVIGCDTLVQAPDGSVLEKPRDAADARRMLDLHSGRVSVVHSGLFIVHGERSVDGLSSSSVHFAELSEETKQWWIDSGLWKSRAGGFQIDGPGQLMIRRLEGDWTSVVGLPVYLLGTLLTQIGWHQPR